LSLFVITVEVISFGFESVIVSQKTNYYNRVVLFHLNNLGLVFGPTFQPLIHTSREWNHGCHYLQL